MAVRGSSRPAAGAPPVLLRDDDANFFTSPAELERAYGDLWNRGPITLALIPYVVGGVQPFVPESHRRTGREYALGGNSDLVAFLRAGVAAHQISIALHGCTHEDVRGRPEFVGAAGLAERLRRGRAHLEDTLGVHISAFVPPHNRLSLRGYHAVRCAGLNLLNLPAVRVPSRPLSWWVVRTVGARIWYQAVWRCEYPRPVYADGHWELGCQPLTPRTRLAGLHAALSLAASRRWPFALATHYWEAIAPLNGGTVRGAVRDLLALIERTGPARFVTPDQIFAAAQV